MILSKDIQQCINNNTPRVISAQPGQRLNISLIDMHDSQGSLGTEDFYGSVKDISTNKNVAFGHGDRVQHLLVTNGHEAEMVLKTRRISFVLMVQGK